MRVRLTDERRERVSDAVRQYFAEELDEEISDFRLESLIDFFVAELDRRSTTKRFATRIASSKRSSPISRESSTSPTSRTPGSESRPSLRWRFARSPHRVSKSPEEEL